MSRLTGDTPLGRVVFLDFDGTVADDRGVIPPSAAEAIGRVRDNGHRVVLATGRSRRQLPAAVHGLGFDALVTASGAFVERGGEVVVQHLIPEAEVHRLVETFERSGLDYLLQGFEHDYGSDRFLARVTARAARGGAQVPDMTVFASLPASERDQPVAKAVFVGASDDAFARVAEAAGPGLSVITGTMRGLGTSAGEVMAAGVDKGAAAAEVLRRYGIPPRLAIAIGDSRNDLELFRLCGTSIAMGDAADDVRSLADSVTSAANEDGLLRAFEDQHLV